MWRGLRHVVRKCWLEVVGSLIHMGFGFAQVAALILGTVFFIFLIFFSGIAFGVGQLHRTWIKESIFQYSDDTVANASSGSRRQCI